MQAGPKKTPTAPLLTFDELPKSRAARCIAFIQAYLIATEGVAAGQPVKLRSWQKALIRGLLRPGIRQGLISVARGNAKSFLAACLCLYFFFADRAASPRVLCVASSEPQARLVFELCVAMIEANPLLAEQVQVFQHQIVRPATGAVLKPLPAASRALQGFSPSFCVVDELAVVDDLTFESMALALGKRPHTLLLSISTAPLEDDTVMHRLREHGIAADDKTFFFKEWAVPAGADHRDESVWPLANPGLGDILDIEAVRSQLRTTREASFRKWRLNQMVLDDGDRWLPVAMFELLADKERRIADGERVVISFDGSVHFDGTALCAVSIEERPHVALLGLWERPEGADNWEVPREDVTGLIEAAVARWDCVEIPCDPHWWRDTISGVWEKRWGISGEGGKVLTWPTHVPARMCPATDRAYAAIAEGRMSHSGDPRLERHVRNAVVRHTSSGDMVGKEYKMSRKRIDACVAMIIGLDRAAYWLHQPVKRRRVVAL